MRNRLTLLLAGIGAALLSGATLFSAVPAALALSAGPPQWRLTSVSGPTDFKPSSSGDVFIVTATNVGGEPASGPVKIEDTLPEGIEATAAPNGSAASGNGDGEAFTGSSLACPTTPPSAHFTCAYPNEPGHEVAPGDTLTFTIPVKVTTAIAGQELENQATVSGGGAASVSTSGSTKVTDEQVPFGVAGFFSAASTTQAGAHPNFTTNFALNLSQAQQTAGSPRDIEVGLPPGLTGDPLAVPRCNVDDVRRRLCPETDAVGVATVSIGSPDASSLYTTRYVALVYDVTPYRGEPAAFAFQIAGGLAVVRLDTSVIPNPGGEYAVRVSAPYINQSEPVISSSVTLWGVPADHDRPGPDEAEEGIRFGGGGEPQTAKPFMRNPTSCAGSATVGFEVDSWQQPGEFQSPAPSVIEGATECGLLSPLFTPSIAVAPDTRQAGAPAGYEVNLEVPQSDSAQRLATPDLKDATVALPAGTVASPSAANGLEACGEAQFEPPSTGPPSTGPPSTGPRSIEPAACPQGSQIGAVRIKTPLLEEELTGQVLLGQPECSPCTETDALAGRMVRLLVQAEGAGVRIKLKGRTEIDQRSGQLTTVFAGNPQQPFEKLTLRLDGGPAAPLANPSICGMATTASLLAPWSGGPPAEPSSGFRVEGCGAPRFDPAFIAGMTGSAQAGGYSPFSVTISRTDQDQSLGGVTVQTPPGLLGMVSHVTQCPEAQANAGTCPQASEIGTVTTGVGPGPAPYYVSGGRAFLTGPYKGAPFGLSIVVPAVAGPFNLGQEIVRAAIYVDPRTAALTIVSDPLPQIKDGIPLQIKTVDVDVDRAQFMFNATDCDAMAIGSTISSAQGARSSPASPYQAVNCAALPFSPSFTVSTQARTSRAGGASLDVKVGYTAGQANIHKVDVQLPPALPARLSTLNKACTAAQFAANPAGCPAASDVGTATASTPVLSAPLTGPAYFVSHGGAAFPDLVIVLQGEGVVVDLVGNTAIKNGTTFSRFESVPDAPISSFELRLPEGPYSALAANGNLCRQSLVMPTTIVAQSGRRIDQRTKIAVVGCARAKPSIGITKHELRGNALVVTVKTSAKGTVRIGGKGLRTTIKKGLTAGRHQIVVLLAKARGETGKHHHRKIRLHASLTVGSQAVAKIVTVDV